MAIHINCTFTYTFNYKIFIIPIFMQRQRVPRFVCTINMFFCHQEIKSSFRQLKDFVPTLRAYTKEKIVNNVKNHRCPPVYFIIFTEIKIYMCTWHPVKGLLIYLNRNNSLTRNVCLTLFAYQNIHRNCRNNILTVLRIQIHEHRRGCFRRRLLSKDCHTMCQTKVLWKIKTTY